MPNGQRLMLHCHDELPVKEGLDKVLIFSRLRLTSMAASADPEYPAGTGLAPQRSPSSAASDPRSTSEDDSETEPPAVEHCRQAHAGNHSPDETRDSQRIGGRGDRIILCLSRLRPRHPPYNTIRSTSSLSVSGDSPIYPRGSPAYRNGCPLRGMIPRALVKEKSRRKTC